MKHPKRTFSLLLAAAVLLTALAGCSKVKDIKLTSFGVESYSMKGLRSVDAVLSVGVDNPSVAFTLTGLNGTVKYNGEDFATYSADTVSVRRKSAEVYDVPCSATLSSGVGLMQVLSIIRKGGTEGFTTDLEAVVTLRGGAKKKLKFKDLDLKELMK